MADPRKERRTAYWLVNALTCSRAAIAVGTLGWILASGQEVETIVVGGRILISNMVLDMVDGPLARALKVESPEGAMRDALADGSMASACLACGVMAVNKAITLGNPEKIVAVLGVVVFAVGFTAFRVYQERLAKSE